MSEKPTLAIYGIKSPDFVHDHNMCLMQDGEIIQYLSLERVSRRKYDNRLELFFEDLVDKGVFPLPDEFELVCVNHFVGNSFISKTGRMRFDADGMGVLHTLEFASASFQRHKWKIEPLDACLCSHEAAHIYSNVPFYGEFRDNSLCVSLDGGSSLGNYSAFLNREKKDLKLIENGWDELGYISKLFNDNPLAFKMLNADREHHCSVPGKLMGFASWGYSDDKIKQWLVKNDYFFSYWGREDEILESIRKEFGTEAQFDTHDRFMQDIAATMQSIFEEAVLRKLTQLQDKYHADYLYYGGGCALNIVTNTKIAESGLFKDVFIAPCCNDSGLSIGAAALCELYKWNKIKKHSPYLCNTGLDSELSDEIQFTEIEKIASVLLSGGIVGVCNGNGECGPRALGNRSLIALANSEELSRKISMQVKKREWYRPVAPIMLYENAQKVVKESIRQISQFMLMDFHIKGEYKEALAGVVHANGTARIQIVDCGMNRFMHILLRYLWDEHGVLALINTSFNVAGEPIVNTAAEARNAAREMGLDGLVLNGRFFKKGDF